MDGCPVLLKLVEDDADKLRRAAEASAKLSRRCTQGVPNVRFQGVRAGGGMIAVQAAMVMYPEMSRNDST